MKSDDKLLCKRIADRHKKARLLDMRFYDAGLLSLPEILYSRLWDIDT